MDHLHSAYATDIYEQRRLSEQLTLKAFLRKLYTLDTSECIEAHVWLEFSGIIRAMLNNS